MAKRAKLVTFSLKAPGAEAVCVAGSFNDWSTTADPMKKGARGVWKGELKLAPGTYEYKFLVDGQWISDPKSKESVANEYGTENSVITV